MPYTHMPLVSSFNVDTVPRQVHEPAGHFEYEMILVTEGSVTATIAHRTYMLTRGSLAFIGRLESHAFLIQKVPYGRFPFCPPTESFPTSAKMSCSPCSFCGRRDSTM